MSIINSSKVHFYLFTLILFTVIILNGCSKEDSPIITGKTEDVLNTKAQIKMQVVFDASNAAFRFKWRSLPKTLPSESANTGKVYPC